LVRRAVARVRDNYRWEHAGQSFFSGDVELCINGRTVALGIYLDQDVNGAVSRLLDEQLGEGGWNCEKESCCLRSSFATTSNVLEGLLAHERATVARPNRSRLAGMVRNTSSNEHCPGATVPAGSSTQLGYGSFPTRWRYDVLRALEYFRAVGALPDSRLGEAIDLT
jgi:hypothetical protein